MIDRATTMKLPEYLMIEDTMTTYLEYALFLKKRPKVEIMKLLQEKA